MLTGSVLLLEEGGRCEVLFGRQVYILQCSGQIPAWFCVGVELRNRSGIPVKLRSLIGKEKQDVHVVLVECDLYVAPKPQPKPLTLTVASVVPQRKVVLPPTVTPVHRAPAKDKPVKAASKKASSPSSSSKRQGVWTPKARHPTTRRAPSVEQDAQRQLRQDMEQRTRRALLQDQRRHPANGASATSRDSSHDHAAPPSREQSRRTHEAVLAERRQPTCSPIPKPPQSQPTKRISISGGNRSLGDGWTTGDD